MGAQSQKSGFGIIVALGLVALGAGTVEAGGVIYDDVQPEIVMRRRVRRVFNRSAHELVQRERRAALEAFRSVVRLETGADLTGARDEAVDWTRDERPEADGEQVARYDAAERAARIAAFEASERHYKAGYQQALARARRISKEYRSQLEREVRREILKSTLAEYRRFCGRENRAQRAAAAARKIRQRAEAELERKVRERLLEAEQVELRRLQVRADEKAIETYARKETAAYHLAKAEIEHDAPVGTEWRDESPAAPLRTSDDELLLEAGELQAKVAAELAPYTPSFEQLSSTLGWID